MSKKTKKSKRALKKWARVFIILFLSIITICSFVLIIKGIFPNNNEAKYIKIYALIYLNKPQEALNILYSLKEEEKITGLFTYLNYLAYKILVEDNPSNYNKSMLDFYINELDHQSKDVFSENELINYINKTLNINKG